MIIGAGKLGVTNAAGNKVDITDAEIGILDDIIVGMTQVSTPASGTNGTQFVFTNADGVAIASARTLEAYISDVNGLPVAAITSFAALTNGSVDLKIVGKIYNVMTTAAGLLGITFTGSAATRYVTFVLPNGLRLISTAIVIN